MDAKEPGLALTAEELGLEPVEPGLANCAAEEPGLALNAEELGLAPKLALVLFDKPDKDTFINR